MCAPGRSLPGLFGPKLGGAEAEPRRLSGIRRQKVRDRRQLREPGPKVAACAGGGASEGILQRKLPFAPERRPRSQTERQPLLVPFPRRAASPGTLPKCPHPGLWPRPPAEEAAATGGLGDFTLHGPGEGAPGARRGGYLELG